ncbi:MAG: TerC family protein [Pseudomonadota bacterium]|nr:TerC family protein [Pseudomonadota bacterium]
MDALFTIDNFITLLMLIALQAILGFDNLLYISLESKKAPEHQQSMVRKLGIGLAVLLRIVLLFVLVKLISYVTDPFFSFDIAGIAKGSFNLHSIIVLIGGIFILYTAMKEIWHMTHIEEDAELQQKERRRSAGSVIFLIVLMNLVFSFDSILSAIALTDQFIIMATAIIIGGILMIWLADNVATFLEKNRMYEVMGLFILFVVGIMLISEGGHLAHLVILDNEITPMTKGTFYFVIIVLVLSDIVQSRYQRKLTLKKLAKQQLLDK